MEVKAFFALLSRMKYIVRWSLMRNSRQETLSEHSHEVAVIAHALCVIANSRFGKDLDANKAAVVGLYHDATEIITGDMPTPVKYYNKEIKAAYKEVERAAEGRLLLRLPDDMKETYLQIFVSDKSENDEYMRNLVKAADKISAYIKCIEEEKSGNSEFTVARLSIEKLLNEMGEGFPEVRVFMSEFLPAYGKTLDELSNE